MAEKGFGVKEINLIGASGTPTIESPNNLNLNAINVAISTNVSIGGTLSVTGNVSVGGTLTYEDVTNIDSVGLITARKGIVSSGVVTATAFDGGIKVVAANSVAATVYPVFAGSGATQSGNLDLKTDNSLTYNSLSGELTAVKFTGDGSSLTSLPAATPTDSDIQVAYTVTANGSSAYRFAGNGVVSTADNPDLYLIRGQKYRFINNSGGSHPFQIRESSGGSAYSTGVTNNGAASGNIDFAPTFDSPAQLVYQCTSHGGMVGNIYLRDAAGGNTNVGVTTFSGGITVSGNTSFAGGNVTMTASGSPNSLNVSGTSRFEIASIENAEIDGEIAHSGDTDTKISFDTNTIKFNTAGSERLRITSGGSIKVGFINNVNPTTMFDVMANAINQDIVRFTGANYNRGLKISTAASGAVSDALIKYDAESQNSAGQHAFLTDGTDRVRIKSDGKVVIGNTSGSGTGALTIYPNSITGNGRLDVYGGGDENAQSQSKCEVMRIGRGDILDQYYHSIWSATGSGGATSHFLKFNVSNGSVGATTQKEALSMNGNGTITTPHQFHIEVRRSGNQTGYDARSSAGGTPVVFNDVVRTRGTANSALNTSTGKITVPVDGVYFLEASVYTTAGNALSQGWFTEGSSRMTYSDITED